jgi:hypothetical protein
MQSYITVGGGLAGLTDAEVSSARRAAMIQKSNTAQNAA